MSIESGATVTLSCCDLWGNAGGDWIEAIGSQYGVNGNISDDPIFCDPNADELTIREDSPCAREPGCDVIGAWPIGCDSPAAVELPVDRDRGSFRVLPNPSSGPVSIQWAGSPSAGPAPAFLTLYDIRGRLVRGLRVDAGGTIIWDGTGADGKPVGSGIYFLTLGRRSDRFSERIVRLR